MEKLPPYIILRGTYIPLEVPEWYETATIWMDDGGSDAGLAGGGVEAEDGRVLKQREGC